MSVVQEANKKLGSDFIHPKSKAAQMLQATAALQAIEVAAGKVCSTKGTEQARMILNLKRVMARSPETY